MSDIPAFPVPDVFDADGCGVREGSYGMSLRDYFAIHAPCPLFEKMATERSIDRNRNPHNDAHKPAPRDDDRINADLRYRFADAMLAAREAKS